MNEKKAPKVKNADRLAATSARCLSAAAGTSGDCDRASTPTNAVEQQSRHAEQQQRRSRRPAVVGAPVERVDEQQQAAGDRRRAGGVEPAVLRWALSRARTRTPCRSAHADRHVDEEHPAPARVRRSAARWR